MDSLLFSIIVPTYNRAHFLGRTIASVLNQTYVNWELLIVDDGSTDNTKDLVLGYSDADRRIKYIYQENKRVSAARNNGLQNAQGDYLCFLDSDDEFKPDHLQTFANAINEGSNRNLLFTHFLTCDDGKEIPFVIPQLSCDYGEKWNNILKVFMPYSPPVQCICVPAFVKQYVLFDEKMILTECYDFCAKCADLLSVVEINKVTVVMHAHQANISVARSLDASILFNKRHLWDLIIMRNDYFYKAIKKTSLFKSKIQSVYFDLIKLNVSKNEYISASRYLIHCIKDYPEVLWSKKIPVLLLQIIKNK